MNIENQPEEVIKLTLGQRLKQAREALGMSQGDVAEQQCLRLTIIRDIESDTNSDKVPDVFWRGYIRAYARQVNLSDDELNQYFSTFKPDSETKRTSMRNFSQKEKTKKRDKWLMFLTIIILLVMLGFSGVWWWQKHQEKQQEIAGLIEQTTPQEESTPSSEHETVSLPERNAVQHQPAVNIEPVEPQLTAIHSSSQQLSQQPVASVTEAEAPTPALVINFSQDCWIQVMNTTTHEVIYSGMKRKGQQLSYDNDIAYYLKIGAPTGVEVLHHNKKVDLRGFIKHGSTVAHVNLNVNN